MWRTPRALSDTRYKTRARTGSLDQPGASSSTSPIPASIWSPSAQRISRPAYQIPRRPPLAPAAHPRPSWYHQVLYVTTDITRHSLSPLQSPYDTTRQPASVLISVNPRSPANKQGATRPDTKPPQFPPSHPGDPPSWTPSSPPWKLVSPSSLFFVFFFSLDFAPNYVFISLDRCTKKSLLFLGSSCEAILLRNA